MVDTILDNLGQEFDKDVKKMMEQQNMSDLRLRMGKTMKYKDSGEYV